MPRFPPLLFMHVIFVVSNAMSYPPPTPWYEAPAAFQIPLPSGDILSITLTACELAFSLVCLGLDLRNAFYRREHALGQLACSLLMLLVGTVQFVNVPGYGNLGFLNFLMIVLCDMAAVQLILLAGARRRYHRDEDYN